MGLLGNIVWEHSQKNRFCLLCLSPLLYLLLTYWQLSKPAILTIKLTTMRFTCDRSVATPQEMMVSLQSVTALVTDAPGKLELSITDTSLNVHLMKELT